MRKALRILKFAALAILALAVFALIVMRLWNWLVPPIIGWHAITYWQALGVMVLSKILFGGFRGGPGHRAHWRHRMMERWARMTPEERERFRQQWHGRCGHFEGTSETKT